MPSEFPLYKRKKTGGYERGIALEPVQAGMSGELRWSLLLDFLVFACPCVKGT